MIYCLSSLRIPSSILDRNVQYIFYKLVSIDLTNITHYKVQVTQLGVDGGGNG